MEELIKKIMLLLLTGLMLSCATSQPPSINLGIIENKTQWEVSDIKVTHYPMQTVANFSYILPHSSAQLGFSERAFLAESGTLSWTHGTKRFQQSFDLGNRAKALEKGQKYTIVYRIFKGGKATVNFVQKTQP